MRAVCQRVSRAHVSVGGVEVARVGLGLVVLLGVAASDDQPVADRLAGKVARLRIFEGAAGNLDRSLLDVDGSALVVSQFTLIADTRRGNRPSFGAAADLAAAELVYEGFCEALAATGARVEQGVFGARMTVELVNEGPVTIVLDREVSGRELPA